MEEKVLDKKQNGMGVLLVVIALYGLSVAGLMSKSMVKIGRAHV